VNKRILLIIQVFIVMILTANSARAANSDICKTFRVIFENTISNIPQSVYANGERIGKVDRSENIDGNSLVVFVCIDNKHSGKFEKNSVCYVSGDKIVVYNVWSTGVDLKEGESVRGFTGRIDLYVYEVKELLILIRDVAIAFVLDIAGKLFGESQVLKVKDMLGIIMK